MKPASRVDSIQEYYFSRKLKEVAKLNAEGKDIISLAIGSPDMPPSKQTIDKLCAVANEPDAHGYQPTSGLPELPSAALLSKPVATTVTRISSDRFSSNAVPQMMFASG